MGKSGVLYEVRENSLGGINSPRGFPDVCNPFLLFLPFQVSGVVTLGMTTPWGSAGGGGGGEELLPLRKNRPPVSPADCKRRQKIANN